MRLDLIIVGPAFDQAVIRFNPRLTVVGGMDQPERGDFVELLLGAVMGGSPELRSAEWLDNGGRRMQARWENGGWRWWQQDGTPCDSLMTVLGTDDLAMRRLMILSARDLAAMGPGPTDGESPELAEVRATLAAIDAELADALTARAEVEALRSEVAELDESLRSAESDSARRRHALLVDTLRRVRIEAESLRGGASAATNDRSYIDGGIDVPDLFNQWRQAREAVSVERRRFGNRERLDPRTLADALATPEQVPPELDALAADYERAEGQRSALAERLAALAADALPEPSHPAVVRLAHAEQEHVWATNRRAVEAGARLEHQSLALGGLATEGVAPTAASDLETAHDAVDLASRELNRRRTPGLVGAVAGVVIALGVSITPLLLLFGLAVLAATAVWAVALPAREVQRRRSEEADALQRAGVASYMTFQLRRMEVNIDPKATEPLELAAMEYRRAMASWRTLAGDVVPCDAVALEQETRAYAAALAGSRGAVDQIAQVRHQLAADAEPAVERARGRLIAACAPFGIDDPRMAVNLVRHQAGTSTIARLQAALEAAEHQEAQARANLEWRLGSLGFGAPTPTPPPAPPAWGQSDLPDRWSGPDDGQHPGPTNWGGPPDDDGIERRVAAFNQARAVALARDQARAHARPVEDVEADLARLESLVASRGHPEWSDVAELDGPEPDRDALRARRAALAAEFEAASRHAPDIERLTDRREAVERRIAVLQDAAGGQPGAPVDDLGEALLAHLAAARRVGPRAESITVVLDEPFENVHGDRKWNILDAADRFSAAVQLIYLTNDVDVLVWARGRAASGSVSLLEPSPEPAI